MRVSRKRARRIAEERAKEAEKEREAAKRAAEEAAAAQARYEAACKGAVLPSRRYPHSRRLKRSTRRAYLLEQARARFARQAAVTAAFSTACLARLFGTAGTADAAYHDPMHDIESELSSLRDQRDEIRNYQLARENLRAARQALAEARKDLSDAKAAVADAKASVASAEQNLALSQQALAQAKEHLKQARAISAEKTREAIAAQQAAYDYQQEVYARQAAVDELSAEQESLAAQAEAASASYAGAGQAYQAATAREAAVQKALAEVGYEQNRLSEAIRLADEYTNAHAETEDASEVAEEAAAAADAASDRLDEVSSALDDAEASLDEAQSYLEELEDARQDAEDAEADARADERDAENDERDAENDVAESEKSLDEAHAYDASTQKWEQEAEKSLEDATKDEDATARDLWHFGEGAGLQTGIEYAHVKGEDRGTEDTLFGPARYAFPHRGHQLFFPFSVYDTERLDKYPGQENVVAEDWPKGEARHVLNLGLSTGWLSSHATVLPVNEEGPDAHEEASSVGRIDTTLSAVYENDHPIGSTRFGLTINAPTGQSRFYQSALVPKGLGFFEDFGKGWEFTPSIEGIHRVTERDSLSARLSYTIREPYKFSMEVPEAETEPGNQTSLDLSYRHIGKAHQLHTWATFTGYAKTKQSRIGQDDEGNWLLLPDKEQYREGNELEIGAAANWQVGPKDVLGVFGSYGHAMRVHGLLHSRATDDYEFAVSFHHDMTPRLSWEGTLSRYHSSTGYNNLYLDDVYNNSGWTRLSLLGVLDWKVTEKDRLTLTIERYLRQGLSEADDQGYAVALWYMRSF